MGVSDTTEKDWEDHYQEIMGEAAEFALELEQKALKYGERDAYMKVIELIKTYDMDETLQDIINKITIIKDENYESENRCI